MAEIFCSQCGASNQAGSRFCSKCGKPLPSQVPAQPGMLQYSNIAPQKKRKSKVALIIVIAVIIVAGGVLGTIALTGGFGGMPDEDYYDIGTDTVPSVSKALGEERKVRSKDTSTKDGVEMLTIVYDVSGDEQGEDMREYYAYLCGSGGFVMRSGADESSFDRQTGSQIQAWRNAKDADYMVIVQADYDAKGYTVTLMRGPGQIDGQTGGTVTPGPGTEYASAQMGFTLLLPDGWTAKEDYSNPEMLLAGFIKSGDDKNAVAVLYMPSVGVQDFETFRDDFVAGMVGEANGREFTLVSEEDVKIGGYDAKYVIYNISEDESVLVVEHIYFLAGLKGGAYALVLAQQTDDTATHTEAIAMIKSFTMTEPAAAAATPLPVATATPAPTAPTTQPTAGEFAHLLPAGEPESTNTVNGYEIAHYADGTVSISGGQGIIMPDGTVYINGTAREPVNMIEIPDGGTISYLNGVAVAIVDGRLYVSPMSNSGMIMVDTNGDVTVYETP